MFLLYISGFTIYLLLLSRIPSLLADCMFYFCQLVVTVPLHRSEIVTLTKGVFPGFSILPASSSEYPMVWPPLPLAPGFIPVPPVENPVSAHIFRFFSCYFAQDIPYHSMIVLPKPKDSRTPAQGRYAGVSESQDQALALVSSG